MNIPTWRSIGRGRRLAAVSVLLAACGGADLLLIAVVTPLNGLWLDSGTLPNESVQFVSPDVSVQLFEPKYEVQANLLNPVNTCDVPDDGSGVLAMAGSFDNGKLVLHAKDSPTKATCIAGEIRNLIDFAAVAGSGRPARSYRNSRVDVQMDLGVWASEGNTVRLKFAPFTSIDNDDPAEDIQACDVSPGATAAFLEGSMKGYDTRFDLRPVIDALKAAAEAQPRFTQIEFVDGGTLSLRNVAGQTVTLKRQKEAAPTTCP